MSMKNYVPIAIATFWIDSVTNKKESDWYEPNPHNFKSETISVNHWGSPKLTDHSTKIAIGKREVNKLWKEHMQWLDSNK